jgi:hypothetical protein
MPASASLTTSPGLFYPDISSSQGAMDLGGVHAVSIKRSEGDYYLNPYYKDQVAKANEAGAFHFAYHFLTNNDPKSQAKFCFDHLGGDVPLMVDVETEGQTGSKPTLAQNIAFVEEFRHLGGTVHLNYLPHWYWESVWGKPSLKQLRDLNLALVSSAYSVYSAGIGWAPYGGWTPTVWQYSDHVPLHGLHVDFNAFLGSGTHDVPTLISEFKSVVQTGALPGGKTWHAWETAGHRSLQEIAHTCGMSPAQVLRATAVHFGHYDQVTHDYVNAMFSGTQDATAHVPAGARLWVLRKPHDQ